MCIFPHCVSQIPPAKLEAQFYEPLKVGLPPYKAEENYQLTSKTVGKNTVATTVLPFTFSVFI